MLKIARTSVLAICLLSITYIFSVKNSSNTAQQDGLALQAKWTHSFVNKSNTGSWIDRRTETITKKDDNTLKQSKLKSNRPGEFYPITLDKKVSKEASDATHSLGVPPVSRVGEGRTIGVKSVVGNKYLLEQKVGGGAYGLVYLGTEVSSGEKVAIKVNRYKTVSRGTSREERIGSILKKEPGFPVVRWSGRIGSYDVIVMDLLGPNLQTYFEYCFKKFSLKTVLLLADQLIHRLEFIHSKGYVHNDLKPCNCAVGLNDRKHMIYLIDFGLSEPLRNRVNDQHIPHRGNAFSSINTHCRIQPSPRDDLESLGYMLLLFLRGDLPWQKVKGDTIRHKQTEILKKKQAIPITDLCKSCPVEFAQYLTVCRSLRFNEKPDYKYLRNLFKILYDRNNFTSDITFDWDIPSGACDVNK